MAIAPRRGPPYLEFVTCMRPQYEGSLGWEGVAHEDKMKAEHGPSRDLFAGSSSIGADHASRPAIRPR
jgi:hypothetical protein